MNDTQNVRSSQVSSQDQPKLYAKKDYAPSGHKEAELVSDGSASIESPFEAAKAGVKEPVSQA